MNKILSLIFLYAAILSPCYSQDSLDVTFNLKVFLQGSFNNGSMETILKQKGFIPLSQPYNVVPWDYNGNEKVKDIPENVVDWILVELSNEPNELAVSNRKACLLKSNGDVMDLNNRLGIVFTLEKDRGYYIIIHHRNHLPVISSSPLFISDSSISYDFTEDQGAAFDSFSLTELGDGVFGMISGDSDSNEIINSLDFKEVATHLFKEGYFNCDLDLNGVVNVLDYGQTNINISKKELFSR